MLIETNRLKKLDSVANLNFPSPADYSKMLEDIQTRGLKTDLVVTPEYGVVCGYTRLQIAEELGIEKVPCKIQDFKDEDELIDYAIKDNLLRRHLSLYHRGIFALKLLEIEKERAKKRQNIGHFNAPQYQDESSPVKATLPELENDIGQARDIAAKKAGIGGRTLDKIKTIEERASKEIKEKLHKGEITVNRAYNDLKKEKLKEERKRTRENKLAHVDTEQKYRAVVIDPPWPVQKIIRDTRPNQDVMDYPTLPIEEIQKLPIRDLGDKDGCHVYLWTTHRFLPSALELFKTWGVRYECLMTWVKPTGPTPFSWMYNVEFVLFGRIGSLPIEQKGMKLGFEAPVQKHSKKPDVFYDMVRKASPEPRIDLFAREKHEGFTSWGN